jgi:hypothetical protein
MNHWSLGGIRYRGWNVHTIGGHVLVGEVLKGVEAEVILIDVLKDEVGIHPSKGGVDILLKGELMVVFHDQLRVVPIDKLVHVIHGSHDGTRARGELRSETGLKGVRASRGQLKGAEDIDNCQAPL